MSAALLVLRGRRAAMRDIALFLDLRHIFEHVEDVRAAAQRGHEVARLAKRLLDERRVKTRALTA